MRTKGKILAALVCCMLVIGLLPTTVFAAEYPTTVLINGQTLTSGSEVACGEGTAMFDSQTNTLKLKNATLEATTNSTVLYIKEDLTIVLEGNNTITSLNQRPIYGRYSSLTIKGTDGASLQIETDADALQADGSNITIDGCTVNITSHNGGGIKAYASQNGTEYVGGKLSIQNNANVTVNSNYLAVVGYAGIDISDSTVKATVNGASTNALYSQNGLIAINKSTVEAHANSTKSYPIRSNILSVSNESNVVADSAGSKGISISNQGTISDSTVTAKGYSDAIAGGGRLDISNSTIDVTSTNGWGIWASGNLVIQGNSDITAAALADGKFALGGGRNTVTLIPPDGSYVDVWAGNSSADATAMEGAPLSGETNLSNFNAKYFHSKLHEHVYDQKIVSDEYKASDATCTEKATYYYSCMCSAKGTETFAAGEVNPNNHTNIVKIEAKVPTCTEGGNIEYWHCEACDKFFSDETLQKEISKDEIVLKANGHGKTELKNVKEATCTAEGYTGDKICTVCGETIEKGTVIKPTNPANSDKCNTDFPKTGDSSNMILWIILLFVSGTGLTSAAIYIRRKKYSR